MKMKKNRSKNIISFILITVLLSHLTLLHNWFDDLVLCHGNDGHVAIENTDDCVSCLNVDYSKSSNTVNFENSNCNDYSIDENCFEDAQFIPKSKVIVSAKIARLTTISIEQINKSPKRNLYTLNNITENQNLDRYTTVSLII